MKSYDNFVVKLRNKLRKPMPAQAIKANSSSGLSSVNPMFVIERLNDVFGEQGWQAEYTIIEQGSHVVVKCDFSAKIGLLTFKRQTFGGFRCDDRGDAYKGACTDALTKAASQLGIASEVYKGKYDGEQSDGKAKESTESIAKPIRYIGAKPFNQLINALRLRGRHLEDLTAYLKETHCLDCKPPLMIPEDILPLVIEWIKTLSLPQTIDPRTEPLQEES